MNTGVVDKRRRTYAGTLCLSVLLHAGFAWGLDRLPTPAPTPAPYTLELAFIQPALPEPETAAPAPARKPLHRPTTVVAPVPQAETPAVAEPTVEATTIVEAPSPTTSPSVSVVAPASGAGVELAFARRQGGAPASGAEHTAPGATGDGSGVSTAAYKASLAQLFRRAMRYPEAARRRHISGIVLIELELDADGRVISRRVLESPHTLLAEAAVDTVSRMGQLPKPPEHLGAPARVVVPLSFELQT